MSDPIAPGRLAIVGDSGDGPWTTRWPVMMRLAHGWARWAPRARSALPRWIGRRFGANWRVQIGQPNGACLAVEASSLDVYLQIAITGSWDREVLQVCLSLLSPGKVFYDIGANVGFMSISAAAQFRDAIKVVSFEPQSALASAIFRSARLSRLENVEVICATLGREAGEADLYVGSHSIHASLVAREHGSRAVRCPIYTLDGLIGDGAIPPPDLIKIDVEGAELLVFQGAAEALRRHRPAIVFEADENLLRFGTGQSEVMAFLADTAGYRFYGIVAEPLHLVEVDPAGSWDRRLRNFVALAPDAELPDL